MSFRSQTIRHAIREILIVFLPDLVFLTIKSTAESEERPTLKNLI